ncbi:MAG TPA: GPP34 family phosphoprotein [Bacteroidetes bacterium]|nr:GPP34 family phosphoprotein [Bacteroidota bacterium]
MNHKVTEHFIILSLNPDTGRYQVLGNYLTYGIVGAMLMDLSLAERISVAGHTLITGKDMSATGVPASERMLKTIAESGRQRNIKTWVRRLGNKSAWYRKEMQKYLVKEGILKVDNKRFIGIPYKLHYVAKPGFRKNLINRYKDIILYEKIPDEAELMVLGLMFACKMHKVLSNVGPERRKIRKRLLEITKDNPFASDIRTAIIEIQAAITSGIAATAAMSASTSVSN